MSKPINENIREVRIENDNGDLILHYCERVIEGRKVAA